MITTYSDCPHCGERTKWWKHARKGYLCMQCGYPDPSGPDCPKCRGTTKPVEIGVDVYRCQTCSELVDG
jgi:tRNA(Ile2) C34 agmatinyltransferase TiaS